eukprot:3178392-Prymnesium_polylepis.1
MAPMGNRTPSRQISWSERDYDGCMTHHIPPHPGVDCSMVDIPPTTPALQRNGKSVSILPRSRRE